MKADRQYKYVIESPQFIPRIGRLITGSIQTSRDMTDDEIFQMAKEMSHGTMPSGCRLVSVERKPI